MEWLTKREMSLVVLQEKNHNMHELIGCICVVLRTRKRTRQQLSWTLLVRVLMSTEVKLST